MPTTTALTPADLATITAFAGLPADTVAWLLAHGRTHDHFPALERPALGWSCA